jgi:hypothetical protein
MQRDERGVTAALSRAASASQRAALILERNRLGYTHGGDRWSWKFAHEPWAEGQEYLDKAQAIAGQNRREWWRSNQEAIISS